MEKLAQFKYVARKSAANSVAKIDFKTMPVQPPLTQKPLKLAPLSEQIDADLNLTIWHWNVNGLRTILKK
jgi:hypothetical protein